MSSKVIKQKYLLYQSFLILYYTLKISTVLKNFYAVPKKPFIITFSASFSLSPNVINLINCSPAIFPIAASCIKCCFYIVCNNLWYGNYFCIIFYYRITFYMSKAFCISCYFRFKLLNRFFCLQQI